MAQFQRKPKVSKWASEVEFWEAREALVKKLKAEGTPDARRQLKQMNDVWYDTDPSEPSPGTAWNPKGKQLARGSSAKCDRINSGFNAKGKIPCRG